MAIIKYTLIPLLLLFYAGELLAVHIAGDDFSAYAAKTRNHPQFGHPVSDSVPISLLSGAPCPLNTFYQKFGENDNPERGNTMCAAKDGGVYIAGLTNEQPFLAKFNAAGELLWSKMISQTLTVADLIEDAQGMLVGVGTFGQSEGSITGAVFRYHPVAHQFFWVKVLQGLDPRAASIIETVPGGNYIISINPKRSGDPITELHEINRSTGNLVFGKSRAFSYKSGLYVNTMIRHQGDYYLYGWAHGQDEDAPPFLSNVRHMLMRVDGTTLQPEWAHLGSEDVTDPQASYQGIDAIVDQDSLVSVYTGYPTAQAAPAVYLQKTTLSGAIVWTNRYPVPGTSVEELVAVSDGYLILTHNSADTRYLLKTDKNGHLLFTKQLKVAFTGANLTLSNVGSNQNQLLTVGKYVYLLSFEENSDEAGVLMKMDENGAIADACGFGNPLTINSEELFETVSTTIAPTAGPSQTVAVSLTATVATFDLPVNEICSCGKSACDVKLDLGSDIIVCNDSIVVLDAGAGFETFQWQDGSATQTFSVHSSGTYTLAATDSCGNIFQDTIQVSFLPVPMRTQVIQFYPNQSVVLDGQTYTQPDTVLLNVASTTGGCDSLNTYILEFVPTTVDIECPADLTVALSAGAKTIIVNYADPIATTDCPGAQTSLKRLQGPSSGAAFPAGITQVCYEARNDCDDRDTCCFHITVQEPPNPCDAKAAGCMRFELLSIRLDSINQRRYRIQLTNLCTPELDYLAVQLPNGMVAVAPGNTTTYTAPGTARAYTVRNPNASPFYSIRYKSVATGIRNGQTDIFEYLLPQQAQPVNIQIAGKLKNGELFTTYLNTYHCPVLTGNGKGGIKEHEAFNMERDGMPSSVLHAPLQLQPNPTDGWLMVDLSPWKGQPVQIQVMNAQGQLMLNQRYIIENERLDLNLEDHLKSGLYYLIVQPVEGDQVATRFVLQR